MNGARLIYGTKFFHDLAKMNAKCGPTFELATKEAWRLHEGLLRYVRVRGLSEHIEEEQP